MTKIPLRVSKYFNLLYISYFIIYKTIVIGIIEIGQAKLKLEIYVQNSLCCAGRVGFALDSARAAHSVL